MNVQAAEVAQALSSVSQICGRGKKVVFGSTRGFVHDIATGAKSRLERENNIYVQSCRVEVPLSSAASAQDSPVLSPSKSGSSLARQAK